MRKYGTILQDAPNSINVKNTPLIRELVEDKKKSVLFNTNKGTSGQTVKKVRKTIVPTVKSGEFNKWFNSLSTKQLDEFWSDKKIRRAIERQLREECMSGIWFHEPQPLNTGE